MRLSFVNQLPLIEAWDDVFSRETAEGVMSLASPRLRASQVVDYDTRTSIPSSDGYRSSYDTYFTPEEFKQHPNLFFPVMEKIEEITGYTRDRFEPPTVIRYDKNQSYLQHTDCYEDEINNPVKRVATVIMYLNDSEGGSTEFNNLGIHIYPKCGRLLYFNYDSTNPAILQSTLHTGNSPYEGYKWICTVWIKSAPLWNPNAPLI